MVEIDVIVSDNINKVCLYIPKIMKIWYTHSVATYNDIFKFMTLNTHPSSLAIDIML